MSHCNIQHNAMNKIIHVVYKMCIIYTHVHVPCLLDSASASCSDTLF